MDARDRFATELRRSRAHADMTLEQLARKAHLDWRYLGHLERGRRWPTRSAAAALDAALGARGTLLARWNVTDSTAHDGG